MSRHHGSAFLVPLLLTVALASARAQDTVSVTFDQLDWIGNASSTIDSAWGRATVSFTGAAQAQYFNLAVDGRWVVRNMGVASLLGTGVSQRVATLFDLGVANGVDVSSLTYTAQLTADPLAAAPSGMAQPAIVAGVPYQIGGKGGTDLGIPTLPLSPDERPPARVTDESRIPNFDLFENQKQGVNECVPAAVSNSLRWMQRRGVLAEGLPTSIPALKALLQTRADGTHGDWVARKAAAFKGVLDTRRSDALAIGEIFRALAGGADVEIDLEKHVAMVVAARRFDDGTIELDIADDNQLDEVIDPIHTVRIRDGVYSEGNQTIESFVIETAAAPEPSSVALLLLGVAGRWLVRRQR